MSFSPDLVVLEKLKESSIDAGQWGGITAWILQELSLLSFKPYKLMALSETQSSIESNLFRKELINLRYPLAQLAHKIDWQPCQARIGDSYATGAGRPRHLITGRFARQFLFPRFC
jgi:hypothetical protein